jgi:hypothetical protein
MNRDVSPDMCYGENAHMFLTMKILLLINLRLHAQHCIVSNLCTNNIYQFELLEIIQINKKLRKTHREMKESRTTKFS